VNKNSKNIKNSKSRVVGFIISLIVVLTIVYLAFVFGYSYGVKGVDLNISSVPNSVVKTEVGQPNSVDFSLFWEAWNKIQKNYSGELNAQKLLYGAISGMMVASGDPYTVFLKPEENERFMDDISGEFSGIGIEITVENSLPVVVSPLSDSPAEKAGLKAKDIIMYVDETATSEISFGEVINKIRGEEGTDVVLKVLREGKNDLLEFTITRAKITVASVTWEKKIVEGKNIFYIKVRQFGDDTLELFKQASDEAGNLPVVLDLRNNPGGYLETAVDLASFFVEDGVIVTEENGDGSKKDFSANRDAVLKNNKLIVLVNEGSASASEIMAGAIKDRRQGIIVGETTFGKGSVQILEKLSDNSAVKITVAKWLTPNGSHIDQVGIEPDISVEDDLDTEVDEILIKAIGSFK